jgi:hypothetical protein
MQILEHTTGYLIAMCVLAALMRQQREGRSWHVRVSLAHAGHWLRSLGPIENGFAIATPNIERYMETTQSGFGELASDGRLSEPCVAQGKALRSHPNIDPLLLHRVTRHLAAIRVINQRGPF